jgi:hypothetical protein
MQVAPLQAQKFGAFVLIAVVRVLFHDRMPRLHGCTLPAEGIIKSWEGYCC